MAAIIGSQFCDTGATDIGVFMSVIDVGEYHFLATDINGNVIFRVKDTSSILHNQRTLLDRNGTPIVTFRPKVMSLNHRWIAYRGDSTNKKDKIFSAKQGSKTDLNVFMPDNDDEKICNYKVDGSLVFYKGSQKIANMAETKVHMVKLCENVDSAFIVSLIVILDAISDQKAANSKMRSSLFYGGVRGVSAGFKVSG